MHVGVRHRGVFAHDVHAAELAFVHRVHDLDHRQSRLRIERRPPQFLEVRAGFGVVHPLIVGEYHRDQSRVRRALHVVLPAQGMQPGAGPSHLAGHEAQRDQTARVVGTVHVQ